LQAQDEGAAIRLGVGRRRDTADLAGRWVVDPALDLRAARLALIGVVALSRDGKSMCVLFNGSGGDYVRCLADRP
jgi:hypothetical protein